MYSKMELIRISIDYLHQLIIDYCEDTREMHLALTKLEECLMWLERAKIKK